MATSTSTTTSNGPTASNANSKAPPHPATVGNSFVKQYYHLLAKNPETLHRFYKDDSLFTHGHGSSTQQFISGQKEINEKILSMGYAGAIVNLESGSVDCQTSLNGGVLVMVTGHITLGDSKPRAFVQTFFLAVQTQGYFVLNDVFRCLDEVVAAVTPVVPETVSAIPAPAATKTIPAAPQVVAPVVQVAPPAMVTSPKKAVKTQSPKKNSSPRRQHSPRKQQSPRKQTKQPDSVDATAAAPAVVDSVPKSWASLFSGTKPSTAGNAPSTGNPTQKNKKTDQPNGATAETTTTTTSSNQPPAKRGVLYVTGVPSHTKEFDLRNLFGEFGKITDVSVVGHRNYAFVDFLSVEAMHSVLNSGRTFSLYDKPIKVEERHGERNGRGGSGFNYRGGRGGGGGQGSRGGRGGSSNRRGGGGGGNDKGVNRRGGGNKTQNTSTGGSTAPTAN